MGGFSLPGKLREGEIAEPGRTGVRRLMFDMPTASAAIGDFLLDAPQLAFAFFDGYVDSLQQLIARHIHDDRRAIAQANYRLAVSPAIFVFEHDADFLDAGEKALKPGEFGLYFRPQRLGYLDMAGADVDMHTSSRAEIKNKIC